MDNKFNAWAAQAALRYSLALAIEQGLAISAGALVRLSDVGELRIVWGGALIDRIKVPGSIAVEDLFTDLPESWQPHIAARIALGVGSSNIRLTAESEDDLNFLWLLSERAEVNLTHQRRPHLTPKTFLERLGQLHRTRLEEFWPEALGAFKLEVSDG